MASRSNAASNSIRGDIDTTYYTQQRDMFASGLAAEIGVSAFAVWHAIKSHADWQTGQAWPGIRRLMALTGLSNDTVQSAIKKLVAAHLLRVTKRGQRTSMYVARERMDLRIGGRVICTVVVDFVPATMRERLAKLKGAAAGEIEAADVWAEVELIPGPGLRLDENTGTFKTAIRADEVPHQISQAEAAGMLTSATEAREKLKTLAVSLRQKSTGSLPKN